MNRDGMAVFLERLGHRIIRTESSYWYDRQRRFYLSIPHSQPISPSDAETRRIFSRARCIGVRFPAPANGPGRASYALIIDDSAYDLNSLSANTRSKVRRGLKHCQVRPVDANFVRSRGLQARSETLQRAGFSWGVPDWGRLWDAVEATPDAEVWGALRENELTAFLLVVVVEDCAEILIARSRDDGLRYYSNNALVFAAARDLIRRPHVKRILFGLEALEAVAGVVQFKESMGFRRWPIRQRIIFHPLLRGLLGHPSFVRLVRAMAERRPGSEFWRKLQGLLVLQGTLASPGRTLKEASWTS